MINIKKNRESNKCWQDVEKLEPLCLVGWIAKWYNHYGSGMVFLNIIYQSLKIELLNDPVIQLLGIYSKELETGSQRNISMFITTLFTIAKS